MGNEKKLIFVLAAIIVVIVGILFIRNQQNNSNNQGTVSRPVVDRTTDSGTDSTDGDVTSSSNNGTDTWEQYAGGNDESGSNININNVVESNTSLSSDDAQYVLSGFVLGDIYGNPYRLYDHRGQNIVLYFWATWSEHCEATMQYMMELENEYSNVEFVLITEDDGNEAKPQEISDYMSERGLSFDTILIDYDNEVASLYAVPGYPAAVFVDEEGVAADVLVGIAGKERFEQSINNLIAR
ncbi:MAG: TlpA family protein disulfide reductase [Lachnospirales bacterium]